MNDKITNLQKFVTAYRNRKSDMEISTMLDVSIDEVKSQRKEVLRKNMERKFRKHSNK
ncbi:hypothetical protein SAMN05660297_01787 [Natronincola peptidivorans]|uniref:Uncharacterized protein n=1 Tax=Natronincola peptidivorans TaxID=426128 RepID=A0A1I0CVL7_9FIRM|nr:hypothetical protein [Natronincola peptidivorans]SET23791.1 hypothetical protein SAMN05660297_01787 [Natronincola peptidivorans]